MASVYKRGKTWWVRFQWHKTEIRRSAHTSNRRTAEKYLAELQEEYARLDRGGKPRKTFSEAMLKFLNEHASRLKPSTEADYWQSSEVLNEHFKGLYLDEITKGRISEFISARRADGISDARINRNLACLSSMFKHAIDWEWIDANPARGRKLKEPEGRKRFLTREEFETLRDAASEPLQSIIVVAVETGMRLGEILALEVRDVDYKRGEIRVRETKNQETRTIAMSGAASARIRAQPRHMKTELIFWRGDGEPLRVSRVSQQFAALVRKAKIPDCRFHDLRHTFASWAVQAGHDLYRVGRQLGHKTPAMMQRYAHLRTDDLKKLVGQ